MKFLRYSVLSLASFALGQLTLGVLVGIFRWSSGVATIASAAVVIGPMYWVSRKWVWRQGQRRASQALAFWVVSAASVACASSLAVAASSWARRFHLSHRGFTLLVLLVVGTTYGVFWLARFLVLDRLIFGVRERSNRA
jgi:putative flippase GtrA